MHKNISTNLNDILDSYWIDIFQEAEFGVKGNPNSGDDFTESYSFSAALDPNTAPFSDPLGELVLAPFNIHNVEKLIALYSTKEDENYGDDTWCLVQLNDGRYAYLCYGQDWTFSWQSIIVASEYHHMIAFGLGESERQLLGVQIDFCTEHEDCFYNLDMGKECFKNSKR